MIPLVLTRPAAQAAQWARQLERLGVPTRSCPLISIEPDAAGSAAAWAALPAADAVFFTSPAAVQALGEGPWHQLKLAVCVGPGTAAALRQAGARQVLAPPADAEQFDSEQLWPLLQQARSWAGSRWLWLRGDGGRDWLIARLQEAGAQLELLTVYHRGPPPLSDNALRAEVATPGLWLFSSSEALEHLAQRVPLQGLAALATHPRIAALAERAGLLVRTVRPDVEAVAQAWKEHCARMKA